MKNSYSRFLFVPLLFLMMNVPSMGNGKERSDLPSSTPASIDNSFSPKNGPSSDTMKPCGALLRLRHIESKGVGYEVGYSSIDSLIFQRSHNNVWPFLDLRFHYFNDTDMAANIGIGIRRSLIPNKRAFGVNAYYDYRYHSCHKQFHQWGVGVEYLSIPIDFRINAYIPIKQEKACMQCFFNDYEGDYFAANKCILAALRGANMELGSFLFHGEDVHLYSALGGYYFGGNVCENTFGVKGRMNISFTQYISLEASVTYDEIFKTRVQGQIFINFPFSCSRKDYHRNYLSQPIERNEIIVLNKYCKWNWNY